MKHQFFGIELAHRFVSSEPPDTHTALLNTKTGDIYYFDEAGESFDDPPEDFHESDDCIAIPHQRDLGLGTELVHRLSSRMLRNSQGGGAFVASIAFS